MGNAQKILRNIDLTLRWGQMAFASDRPSLMIGRVMATRARMLIIVARTLWGQSKIKDAVARVGVSLLLALWRQRGPRGMATMSPFPNKSSWLATKEVAVATELTLHSNGSLVPMVVACPARPLTLIKQALDRQLRATGHLQVSPFSLHITPSRMVPSIRVESNGSWVISSRWAQHQSLLGQVLGTTTNQEFCPVQIAPAVPPTMLSSWWGIASLATNPTGL